MTFDDTLSMNELYHHGIKGQKWGIRNGPPYPIGSGKSPKAFLSRHRNKTIGGIQDEWNSLGLPAKVTVVTTVAGTLVSIAAGIQSMYQSHKAEKYREEERQLNRERENRLREREDRLQRQSKNPAGAVQKRLEDMTNEELEKEIKRLRLESEYERLSKDTESEGERFVKDTGKQVAQQVLKTAVNLVMQRYGPKTLENIENQISEQKKAKRDNTSIDEYDEGGPSRKEIKETAKVQKEYRRTPEETKRLEERRKKENHLEEVQNRVAWTRNHIDELNKEIEEWERDPDFQEEFPHKKENNLKTIESHKKYIADEEARVKPILDELYGNKKKKNKNISK